MSQAMKPIQRVKTNISTLPSFPIPIHLPSPKTWQILKKSRTVSSKQVAGNKKNVEMTKGKVEKFTE